MFENRLHQDFTAGKPNQKWCTNLYEFATEESFCRKVEESAYVDYNYVRPHSFNGYRPRSKYGMQRN